MKEALMEAKKAKIIDEVPGGAVIVFQNKIIARSHNRTKSDLDPTAHAEIVVLRNTSLYLNTLHLTECDLYVTIEPCPMCAYAISLAKIRRLYFGAYDEKSGGVENGPCIYTHRAAHHKPDCYGGIAADEAGKIMNEFFHCRRTNKK